MNKIIRFFFASLAVMVLAGCSNINYKELSEDQKKVIENLTNELSEQKKRTAEQSWVVAARDEIIEERKASYNKLSEQFKQDLDKAFENAKRQCLYECNNDAKLKALFKCSWEYRPQ